VTTFTSANAGASNFALTFPAITSTLVTQGDTATVALTVLATQAANTFVANVTNGAASPTAASLPSCTGAAAALQYTSGTGLSCGTITASASSVTVGVTTVGSSTDKHILYDNAGTLGDYSVTGTGTTAVMAAAPSIVGGSLTALTTFALRDTSAAFDVTQAYTSTSATLTAGRTITYDVGNVAHTVKFGTTANTITFPNLASFTVLTSGDTATVTSTILANSLSLVTPNINVAIGTSLALGGATIGTNALAVTGSVAISSTISSAADTITSASANAIAVGRQGATLPAFNVDASTASQTAGLNVKGAALNGTVAVSVIDTSGNTNLTINALGSGTIGIGTISTGLVTITPATTFTVVPTVGTKSPGDNTTAAASTAFVTAAVSAATTGVASIGAATGVVTLGGDLTSVTGANGSISSSWTSGDVKLTMKTTADTGWIILNDGTIGDASSGGTTRANADTSALFTLLWTVCSTPTSNASCAVSGGLGASASADFAAHKTLATPKALGRAMAISGAGSGLTTRVLGTTAGAETETPTISKTASHNHGLSAGTASAVAPTFGAVPQNTGFDAGIANTGGGTALNILDPTTYLNIMIKL
jgi:hypothetical protein